MNAFVRAAVEAGVRGIVREIAAPAAAGFLEAMAREFFVRAAERRRLTKRWDELTATDQEEWTAIARDAVQLVTGRVVSALRSTL